MRCLGSKHQEVLNLKLFASWHTCSNVVVIFLHLCLAPVRSFSLLFLLPQPLPLHEMKAFGLNELVAILSRATPAGENLVDLDAAAVNEMTYSLQQGINSMTPREGDLRVTLKMMFLFFHREGLSEAEQVPYWRKIESFQGAAMPVRELFDDNPHLQEKAVEWMMAIDVPQDLTLSGRLFLTPTFVGDAVDHVGALCGLAGSGNEPPQQADGSRDEEPCGGLGEGGVNEGGVDATGRERSGSDGADGSCDEEPCEGTGEVGVEATGSEPPQQPGNSIDDGGVEATGRERSGSDGADGSCDEEPCEGTGDGGIQATGSEPPQQPGGSSCDRGVEATGRERSGSDGAEGSSDEEPRERTGEGGVQATGSEPPQQPGGSSSDRGDRLAWIVQVLERCGSYDEVITKARDLAGKNPPADRSRPDSPPIHPNSCKLDYDVVLLEKALQVIADRGVSVAYRAELKTTLRVPEKPAKDSERSGAGEDDDESEEVRLCCWCGWVALCADRRVATTTSLL